MQNKDNYEVNMNTENEELELDMSWDDVFDNASTDILDHVDSISDALVLSLNKYGYIDMDYIVSVSGETLDTVISRLKGSIYQNPETWGGHPEKGWEMADEYLSGNLMRKLKAAKEANRIYLGHFVDNINALEKMLPPKASSQDIYVTLGSPWVPADVIDDFIEYLFGKPKFYSYCGEDQRYYLKVVHDELTGTWAVPYKKRYGYYNVSVDKTYGTDRMNALYIIEKTLNMKTIAVTDMVSSTSSKSGFKHVINHPETIALLDRQKKIIKAFQNWVWKDPARAAKLREIFAEKYGSVRRRHFDGSFLDLSDMDKRFAENFDLLYQTDFRDKLVKECKAMVNEYAH